MSCLGLEACGGCLRPLPIAVRCVACPRGSGGLGVRASFTWLLGSAVLPPQLAPGEEAWA